MRDESAACTAAVLLVTSSSRRHADAATGTTDDMLCMVPRDVELTEPVLFFYNEQHLVRTVTRGDLYLRKGKL
jgi:hypothetical protein